MTRAETQLYLDGNRGIYIPQAFAEQTKRECVAGVNDDDWATLTAGPDHEWYWEAWDNVLNNAKLTDPSSGVVYTLHQDGDLWIVPEGMVWSEETETYVWPGEAEED